MQGISVGRLVKRRWTVIVAVLVVAVVAFTVSRLHGIFGSDNEVSRPSADALENTGYNPKRVLFEVFGSPGSIATINYLDIDAQPQRAEDVPLPWSQTLVTDDPTLSPIYGRKATATPSAAASPSTVWSRTKDPPTT